ncbi:DegT/DnrJ/EryC1/StrS family aminotransferase [Hoeflea sp. EC-HK425]|uniref:DegT/DnrJ/EryC1/StrS family aminotransferase n=1 Tax=Hoeflea sp. EC-HK425 TaxID=2038388 RepID=UPI0012598457|nr:DegT/DnrJ/EryC1/StrS family aminotransferase [Hoeflea sp. EC-HK425]VVT20917.1 UDP-2-acetamido-2-deoxy-3-oxo-D-glucuronate aminotransferase [Hoeflea sp. EC-HK425]|tara:strand:+ start:655 stop:1797 length:1143 start_codon:yes stop_codon:yes gene_type:complete
MTSSSPEPVRFVDLAAQQARIRDRVDAAVARVFDHGQYIMGPEVAEFEAKLSAHCGAAHSVACSSGTDALAMVLMAKNVRPGQAIFCPAFTFVATAEVVAWLGAHIWFVDVDAETFNMDPASLETAIASARAAGHAPVGVIPVDLFGVPADYDAVSKIAAREGLWVLGDGAQSYGARYHNRRVGTLAMATATSFFPAKPLGAYGDGGAVFTDDAELAETLRSILFHGKGANQYDNVRIGMTGRIDTVQAAILIEKLAIFDDEIDARNRIAARYTSLLSGHVATPVVPEGLQSVWAQYTVKLPEAADRAAIQARMKDKGVPSAVYYAKPLHRQDAYSHHGVAGGELPVTDMLSGCVLSLPMHPYLEDDTQDRVVEALISSL